MQSHLEDYLPYLGGAAGALFVTGVAYWASRPTAKKPLFPLDAQALLLPGNEHIRVSKFYKEGKDGKFVTFLYEDTRTLYEGFRRGAKESKEIRYKKQRLWVKPWIAQRQEQGIHRNFFTELSLEDPNKFCRCLRMDTATFEELLHKVAPLIMKQNTHLRKNIPPAERLSLTVSTGHPRNITNYN